MQAHSIVGQPERALTTSSDSLVRKPTNTSQTWWKIRLTSVPMAATSAIRSPIKPSVYIDRQKKAAPDKPFFLYYAPGATHAPHQVDKYWSDQYKGKFDKGWDAYREEVFERQKKLGVIPADAKLPDRNPDIKAWDQLSADEKKLYARFMEVYAGYLTYTDFEVGRLINHLKEINQLDNTLVFVMIGDNGASKEGTLNGDIDRPLFEQGP